MWKILSVWIQNLNFLFLKYTGNIISLKKSKFLLLNQVIWVKLKKMWIQALNAYKKVQCLCNILALCDPQKQRFEGVFFTPSIPPSLIQRRNLTNFCSLDKKSKMCMFSYKNIKIVKIINIGKHMYNIKLSSGLQVI